jgi:hypothetical protein
METENPLSRAIFQKRYVDELRLIMRSQPGLLLQKGHDGWLPIHFAAYYKAPLEVVKMLVDECREALHREDDFEELPLQVAVHKNSREVVAFLLSQGPADALERRNCHQRVALHCAAHEGNVDVVKFIAEQWLQAVHEKDDSGAIPLHWAASENSSLDVTQFLVAQWPDSCNAINDRGSRPIDLARQSRNAEVAAWLERYMEGSLEARDPDATSGRCIADLHKCELCEKMSSLQLTVEKTHQLSVETNEMIKRIEESIPILIHLDVRFNNPVPRLFLLVPADVVDVLTEKRSFPHIVRSLGTTEYYLQFICAVTLKRVDPPVKLLAKKGWVRAIAPVLAWSLFILQVSLKVGLNLSLGLDGLAAEINIMSSDLASMLREVSDILNETGHIGLVDRIKSNQLTEGDCRELCGEAYELVAKEANDPKQNGWKKNMVPVYMPPSSKVMWVMNDVARNPKYRVVRPYAEQVPIQYETLEV